MSISNELDSSFRFEQTAAPASVASALDSFRQDVFGKPEDLSLTAGCTSSYQNSSFDQGSASGRGSWGSGDQGLAGSLEIPPISALTEKTAAAQKGDTPVSSDNLCAAKAEAAETPEQRLNRRMTEVFGADVMAHLNADGAEWLRDNAQKIADGFAKVSGQEAWDMARAMRDRTRLPNGDHIIYLSKQDGPTSGTLIPKRHDVYVRGYHWYQRDTQVGQVYPR